MRMIALVATLLASAPAFATGKPPTTPPGNSGPTTITVTPRTEATAISGAAARSAARAASVSGAQATGGQGGGGGSATVNNTIQAGGDPVSIPRERLRTPDVSAPAIWSNNPCVVALSGGVAVAGFGASIGAGVEDRDCTRRAYAQHLQAIGENNAAREVMCNNAEVRAAFARAGRPCAADQAQAVAVRAEPLPVAAPSPSAAPRPAYCGNLLARGLITDECR